MGRKVPVKVKPAMLKKSRPDIPGGFFKNVPLLFTQQTAETFFDGIGRAFGRIGCPLGGIHSCATSPPQDISGDTARTFQYIAGQVTG